MKLIPGPNLPATERIKIISESASEVQLHLDTKVNMYIRSGKELTRMADSYYSEGNIEHAYVLYMRFLTIFVEKLRMHPDYKKEVSNVEKKYMTSKCNEVFQIAESLRKQLVEQYEAEHLAYLKKVEEAAELAEQERLRAEKEEKYQALVASITKPVVLPSAPVVPPPSHANAAAYTEVMPFETENQRPDTVKPSSNSIVPQVDRSSKPNRFLSPINSGLREVVIPGDLIKRFLQYSDRNTKNNIETCGFLTGKIITGKLVVTDLIIPKQTGGPDSCTTHGEEEYIVIQDKYDLIMFGWIHTHPSQTAFLSSVDMHSQYWYQQMMPEALAVVCAPRKNEIGFFILNPDEGMEVIGNCKQTGFHQHPFTTGPLFIEANHYRIDESRTIKVHDIR